MITLDEPGSVSQSTPGHDPKLFRTRSSSILKDTTPKRPTAVTIKDKIIVINVHSNKRTLLHDFYQGIFSTLSKWRLSVDLISTSEVHVSMALHSESEVNSGGSDDDKKMLDLELRSAIDELRGYGAVDIIDGMALLSLVGKQMKNMVGIAGKMFSTLGGGSLALWSSCEMLTSCREQHQHRDDLSGYVESSTTSYENPADQETKERVRSIYHASSKRRTRTEHLISCTPISSPS